MSLPVTLKDGRGGETTETANISAHGIAVITTRPRPLRQYLELELVLPENDVPISITVVVARHADKLKRRDGGEAPGLGLDFFLFDARAKQSWSVFLQALRQRGVSDVAPSAPVRARPPTPAFDDTPTFIIKPRDLGRLWAFYRGEMTKGRVRIETPIVKPMGTTVELLVVHPGSQAEWILEGHIATTNENARGGRPVLEIELDHLDNELKADFRNFVATGRGMIEEDISMSLDVPSAVSEISAPPPSLPPTRPVDLDDDDVEMPPTVLEPSHIQSGPPPAVDEPVSDVGRFHSVVIDLDNLGEEELKAEIVDPPPPLSDESEDATLDGEEPTPRAGAGEEEPTLTPASPEVAADPVLRQALAPEPPAQQVAAPPVTNQHLFSAFFEEAAEAEEHKRSSQLQVEVAHEPTRRLRPPSTSSAASASALSPAIDDLTPPKTGLRLIPRSLVLQNRAMPPDLPLERAPPPPPLPSGDEPLDPLPEPESPMRVVRGAPASEEEAMPRPPSQAGVAPTVQGVDDGMAQNPPVPPGTMFEYSSQEVSAVSPGPASQELPLPPSARRRVRRETVERESTNVHHTSFSTEGTDPALDRDIALARARVVRSPNSVTACYRLSALLVQRGEATNLNDALDTLRRVTELEPNHPGAHHKLAEVLARRGEYLLAAEHLNRARRLGYRTDPDLEAIVAQGVKQL